MRISPIQISSYFSDAAGRIEGKHTAQAMMDGSTLVLRKVLLRARWMQQNAKRERLSQVQRTGEPGGSPPGF